MEDKLQVYLKAEVQLAYKFTSRIPVSSVLKVGFILVHNRGPKRARWVRLVAGREVRRGLEEGSAEGVAGLRGDL